MTVTPTSPLARCLAALALIGAFGASCASGATTALPPAPPVISVTMDEYHFNLEQEQIPPGRVMFSVTNVGDIEHRVALIPLPEDFPPIQEQVKSDEHRFVRELAAIPDTPPGDDAFFAVDLEPGRYGLACFVVEDGTTHAERGMVSEFRVR